MDAPPTIPDIHATDNDSGISVNDPTGPPATSGERPQTSNPPAPGAALSAAILDHKATEQDT